MSGSLTSSTTSGAVAVFNGGHIRAHTDLDGATQGRLTVYVDVVGAAGQTLEVFYSTDGSTWTTTGISVVINPTGYKDSGWVALPAGAKVANVQLRLQTTGGNSSTYGWSTAHFIVK